MAPRISLALALHNHQPVGNFGWVFADVFEQAYLPMVEALERHPGVRLALHYTGPLLEWLRAERPEFIDRLRRAASRAARSRSSAAATTSRCWPRCRSATGSASCGGWPTSSRRLFGRRPRGAWLAERVWEPDLPDLARGRRLRLDDPRRRPLPGGGHPRGRMWGPYTTEDQGRLLTVFGTEQGLRYRIPFRRRGRRSSTTCASTRPRTASASG